LRTAIDSFKRQKPLVRAVIAFTVLAGVVMFVMGISEDEVRLRETGVMLSIVLPIIGLLEDRIYRKSRERYLETKAAAERQKAATMLGSAERSQPAARFLVPRNDAGGRPLVATGGPSDSQPSPGARPMPPALGPPSFNTDDVIEWYGLYG